MANPFDTVHEFERMVAEYTGAPYAIATDCCSHALFLSAVYHKQTRGIPAQAIFPNRTYVSAPTQFIHAGYQVDFDDYGWNGMYRIGGTNIIDSAPRFTKDMYVAGMFQCISFQFKKILSTIRGGMILTDDKDFYDWAQRATHDGRNMSVPYEEDNITMLGYHMFMTPETAQMGIDKMKTIPDVNNDIAGSHTYPDVSYVKGLK